MMLNPEEKLEIARNLKKSLEGRFADIKGFHLDAEYRGDAVLWRYGGYNGTIPIIGELDGAVILEFPQGINSDSSFHSISSLRAVTDIFERFEGYLKEHGEEEVAPSRHPVYYLRKGIPDVSQ